MHNFGHMAGHGSGGGLLLIILGIFLVIGMARE